MNTINNKRKQQSIKKIKEAFMILFNEKDLEEIKVSDICEIAKINRTTFYSTFDNLYDLIEAIKVDYESLIIEKLKEEIYSSKLAKIFNDIYKNQLIYKTYIKLFSDKKHKSNLLETFFNGLNNGNGVNYHLVFFRAGFVALIKQWLSSGCKETPEEMLAILQEEYAGRVEMNFKK